MIHKVVIFGSGPAGLTAGIYTGRAKFSPVIIDGNMPGGQLMTTTDVENWPGDISVKGPELMARMRKHAETYGATFEGDLVVGVDLSKKPYLVKLQSGKELQTETIIIATGSSHKKLQAIGEEEYWGRGVTTCATCDAPFYQDKEVVIAGGGNTAMTEASALSTFASKITIVQLLDEITANDPIKDKVLADPKVNIITGHKILEIKGDGNGISEVIIEDQQSKNTQTIPASGVFVAIGFKPNTGMFAGQLEMDDYGYLKLTNHTKTSKEGVFAAGDVSDYVYQQAVTSAGAGCMAALDAEKYLHKLAT